MHERALHEGLDRFTDDWNTAMLDRAFGEQDARIQTASGIGASRVWEGMGGTRGNAANGLARGYASRSLERGLDIQGRRDASALTGTLQEAGRARASMEHERSSWDSGGWRKEAHAARADYNKKLAEQGQDDFQWALDNWKADRFPDYITAGFFGASSGLGLADDILTYDKNWTNFFSVNKPKPAAVTL